ncbi:MAG: hypothetical protein FWG34_08330 [Oscillospiraceae bacterium]|nr:hypothetical protein [Oscillospiraceae bacterium]
MNLTQQTVIKHSSEYYKLLDGFCFKAKNLHNVALYRLREAYFEYDTNMTYGSMDKVLKLEKSVDYMNMPMAASAQGTLKAVLESWKSFWASVKAYGREPSRFLGRPKMPKYLHKAKGRAIVYLTNQNVKVKDGVLHFPKSFCGLTVPTELNQGDIQQVRVVPKNRLCVIATKNSRLKCLKYKRFFPMPSKK